jgi:hypothetical protein
MTRACAQIQQLIISPAQSLFQSACAHRALAHSERRVCVHRHKVLFYWNHLLQRTSKQIERTRQKENTSGADPAHGQRTSIGEHEFSTRAQQAGAAARARRPSHAAHTTRASARTSHCTRNASHCTRNASPVLSARPCRCMCRRID